MAKHAPEPPKNRAEKLKPLLTLLKEVRRESGLTQIQLAKRLKQPQSYVSKYESGERRLDLFEVHAICKAVKLPLPDFARRFEKLLNDKPGKPTKRVDGAAPAAM